jgi:hypothetical protein
VFNAKALTLGPLVLRVNACVSQIKTVLGSLAITALPLVNVLAKLIVTAPAVIHVFTFNVFLFIVKQHLVLRGIPVLTVYVNQNWL